jgi:hypothetical protein
MPIESETDKDWTRFAVCVIVQKNIQEVNGFDQDSDCVKP